MTLASEWRLRRLDELGFVGRGRSRHRPRNEKRLYGGQYPFIQTADIMNADPYINSYSQTYSEFGFQQSKMWSPGTLCMTIAGANTAKTAILKIEACFPDSVVGFVPGKTKADLHFVKYSLDLMKDRFLAVSRGATQDNLSLDKLLSFQLSVPDLEVQHQIGSILSSFDDLIENNNRRIKILGQMAQMLYREWFVNFRFPGHEKIKMVESDFGSIPQGWTLKRLGEVLSLEYGKALRAEQRSGGAIPVFGSSGVVGYHSERLAHGPGIVVGRKGNVGSVFFCDCDFWVIDTAYYVLTSLPLHFVYFNLLTQNFLNNDAAVPGLNRNQAHSLPVILPDTNTVQTFENHVESFFKLKARLEKRNSNLRTTRDLLVAKLISGEISVEQIEPEVPAQTV
jgi:type I restriction enzyme S subunit